jgi:hypothetical protein
MVTAATAADRVGVADVQAILAVEDVLEQFAAAQARAARWLPEPMPTGWRPPAVTRVVRR